MLAPSFATLPPELGRRLIAALPALVAAFDRLRADRLTLVQFDLLLRLEGLTRLQTRDVFSLIDSARDGYIDRSKLVRIAGSHPCLRPAAAAGAERKAEPKAEDGAGRKSPPPGKGPKAKKAPNGTPPPVHARYRRGPATLSPPR